MLFRGRMGDGEKGVEDIVDPLRELLGWWVVHWSSDVPVVNAKLERFLAPRGGGLISVRSD